MSTLQKTKTERNVGIDLLRCVTMFAIVFIHLCAQGGFFSAVGYGTVGYYCVLPVYMLCFCAVNVYALITGYVEAKFRLRRWLVLWLQVVFLSLAMDLLGEVLERGSVPRDIWIRTFLPVTQKSFWYFTAYSGMFFLLPILRKGLDALSVRGLCYAIFAVFGVFCCGTAIGGLHYGDTFNMGSGYTMLWLTCLYILGFALHRTQLLSKVKGYGLCLCIALSTGLLTLFVWLKTSKGLEILSGLKLYSYANPLHLINAVCLVTLFSRINCGRAMRRAVAVLSPLTFGVYVIHVHDSAWKRLKGIMSFVGGKSLPVAILLLLGTTLAIYAVCSAADWLRLQVFRLVRVPKLCEKTEHFVEKRFNRPVDALTGGKG